MDLAHTLLTRVHVVFAFAGLAAFWIPIVAAKGGALHVRAGRVFVWSVYVVVATALAACFWLAVSPTSYYRADAPVTGARAADARLLAALLAYIAIVTLAAVQHGADVVRTRGARERLADLRGPLRSGLSLAAIGTGMAALALGAAFDSPFRVPLLAMSPIGPAVGFGQLAFRRDPARTPMAWWYEHLGAMIVAGICFHTAFLGFGASRLIGFDPTGPSGALLLLSPTLVGFPAILIWTARYRRKFGEAGAPGR